MLLCDLAYKGQIVEIAATNKAICFDPRVLLIHSKNEKQGSRARFNLPALL